MKAIIYCRVSTTGQALEGISMEAQQAKAVQWAGMNGYEVGSVHADHGISGKRMANRPGLKAALDAVCRERGTVLVVYSLSRLARSTKDAIWISERIEKAGSDLVSLSERIDTTSAAGKMVFRMLAVLSEFERELASERTKAALAHKRSKGERTGEIPFGFSLADDGVNLLPDIREQDTLNDLLSLRQEGLSWQKIADELNRRGIRTKKHKEWSWQTARNVAA